MSKLFRRRPDRRRIAFVLLLVGAAVGGLVLSGTGLTAPSQVRPPPKRTTTTKPTTTNTNTSTRPDLDVHKRGPEGSVSIGSTVTFTLDVGNELNSVPAGTTITVTESVPAGTTLTSIGGAGWTCMPSPPVTGPSGVTCTYVVPS